jgi:hypothetical protein
MEAYRPLIQGKPISESSRLDDGIHRPQRFHRGSINHILQVHLKYARCRWRYVAKYRRYFL